MNNANNQANANPLTSEEYSILLNLISRADLRGMASLRSLNRNGHPKVSLSVISMNGGINSKGYPKRQWLNRVKTLDTNGQEIWSWALGNEVMEGAKPANAQVPQPNQYPQRGYQPNYMQAPFPMAY